MSGQSRSNKALVQKQFPDAYCDNDSGVFVIYLAAAAGRFVESRKSSIDAWKRAYEKLEKLQR